MAAKIRLTRKGSKKRPYYWIVVADGRSPRDGAFIEKLGSYNPLAKPDDEDRVKLNVERMKYWLSVGAEPSDRVGYFLDRFHLRKSTLKHNPKKGAPKEKAQERAEAKGARQARIPVVMELDQDEISIAKAMMMSLVSS